jgi:hypothetical protein
LLLDLLGRPRFDARLWPGSRGVHPRRKELAGERAREPFDEVSERPAFVSRSSIPAQSSPIDVIVRVDSHLAMPEQWRLRVQDTPPVIETDGGTERWGVAFLVLLVFGLAVAWALLAVMRRTSFHPGCGTSAPPS